MNIMNAIHSASDASGKWNRHSRYSNRPSRPWACRTAVIVLMGLSGYAGSLTANPLMVASADPVLVRPSAQTNEEAVSADAGKSAAEQEAGPKVFGLSELDQIPQAMSQASPSYPIMEQRAGVGDTVVVEFIVDDEGRVRNVAALPGPSSLKGGGNPTLSQREMMHRKFEVRAMRAVAQWKFTPGLKAGVPVPTRMRVPISFIPLP
jgi:hypothetical protein